MIAQPGGNGGRLSAYEELYRPAALQIDHDGAVAMPLGDRPVIDPDDPRRWRLRALGLSSMKFAQDCLSARAKPELVGESSCGGASQGESHRLQCSRMRPGPPLIAAGKRIKALNERSSQAVRLRALEALNLQLDRYFQVMAWALGQAPNVTAVQPIAPT